MDPSEEIRELRRELASLRGTVAELVKLLLHESNAFENLNRSTVERRLATAARAGRESATKEEDENGHDGHEPPAETQPSALAATAYRGAVPGAKSATGCAACGRKLDEDDPELSLPKRGRVCITCFGRHSAK